MQKNKPSNILIHGALGRMGKSIINIIKNEDYDHTIYEYDSKSESNISLNSIIEKSDLIIDFSSPEGCNNLLLKVKNSPAPLVVGTTGLTDETVAVLRELSLNIPVVYASNFSLGVNLLFALTQMASSVLKDEFQPEILEIHHKNKRDAPSGTALSLGEAVVKGSKSDSLQFITSRSGETGIRPEKAIGFGALRGGDVVGEHTVFFFGEGERIEITHRATDRAILAKGAWKAGKWVINASPGLYNMSDVLNLK